jgi:hypothetical protein
LGQKSVKSQNFGPKSNVATQIKILVKNKKKMVKNQKFDKTYEIDLFIQQGQL